MDDTFNCISSIHDSCTILACNNDNAEEEDDDDDEFVPMVVVVVWLYDPRDILQVELSENSDDDVVVELLDNDCGCCWYDAFIVRYASICNDDDACGC